MDARHLLHLLLCLAIGLAGCMSPAAQPAPDLEGVAVYFEDDDLRQRYGPLIEDVLDGQGAVYEPLFERGEVRFEQVEHVPRSYSFDFDRDDTASLHVSLVSDPDVPAGGLHLYSNHVLINIARWEDTNATSADSALCGPLGLNTYRGLWPDYFRSALVHEIGHVFGLVGLWWETEREIDGHHSDNPESVMYMRPQIDPVQWMPDGYCYGDIQNMDYDADDLADLQRAAGMRPFYWE